VGELGLGFDRFSFGEDIAFRAEKRNGGSAEPRVFLGSDVAFFIPEGVEHADQRGALAREVVEVEELEAADLTLATAESCTGGLASHWITEVPGVSRFYRGGVVAYSNDAKTNLLGVPEALLARVGAPAPERLQGRDLFERLDAPRPESEQIAITEMTGWKAARTPGYRYIMRASGEELLFDLEADPGEYRNAADDPAYAEVKHELRGKLLRRCIEAERPRPLVWAY